MIEVVEVALVAVVLSIWIALFLAIAGTVLWWSGNGLGKKLLIVAAYLAGGACLIVSLFWRVLAPIVLVRFVTFQIPDFL